MHMEHNEDPFWDPNEFMSMGYSTVFLKPLAYCMPIEDDYAIYHDTQAVGVVHVKITPCRDDGTTIGEEDEGPYDVDEPKDLIGKRLDVLVQVCHTTWPRAWGFGCQDAIGRGFGFHVADARPFGFACRVASCAAHVLVHTCVLDDDAAMRRMMDVTAASPCCCLARAVPRARDCTCIR